LSVLSSVPATDNVSGGTLAGTGNGGNVVLSSSSVVPGSHRRRHPDSLANSLSVTGGTLKFDWDRATSDLFNITGAALFTAASTINIPAAGLDRFVHRVVSRHADTHHAPAVVGPAGTFLATLNTSTRISSRSMSHLRPYR
jgi:hypothetical protein